MPFGGPSFLGAAGGGPDGIFVPLRGWVKAGRSDTGACRTPRDGIMLGDGFYVERIKKDI